MGNRQSYLKSEWTPFPTITHKVLTLQEFEQRILKLNKKENVEQETVIVGGRICEILDKKTHKDAKNEKCLFITNNGSTLGLRIRANQQEIVHLFENLVLGDWVIAEVSLDNLIEVTYKEIIRGIKDKEHGERFDLYEERLKTVSTNDKKLDKRSDSYKETIKILNVKNLKLVSPNTLTRVENFPSYELVQQWQFFIRCVQNVFDNLGFIQVETPSLVKCAGIESEIMPFEVELVSLGKREKRYLATSPEFCLKRLLAKGWTRLYEIKTVYRNNEFTEHHRPEFKMLEWYRGLDFIETLKKDLQVLLDYFSKHWPYKISGLKPLCEITMSELFKKHVHFVLTPCTSREELQDLCQKLGLSFSDKDNFNDLFFRIFIEYIEPELSDPVIVSQYPPSQAIWSRLTHEGWADRFEFYWKGLEIANAFHELNDPQEHRKRFKNAGLEVDEDFIRAIDSGLPPSSGIALGLERLFMAITDKKNISEIQI